MSKIVNKFGGEIMGNKELNFLLLKNLQSQIGNGDSVYVVCSALSQVTNKLLGIIDDLIKTNSKSIINEFIKELLDIHIIHAQKICRDKDNIKKIEIILKKELDDLENSLKFIFDFGYVDFVSDKIVSFGEKLSSHILKIFLEENHIPTIRFSGEEIGITTDSNYTDANILYEESKCLVNKKLGSINDLVLIPGFTGIDNNGRTTTLGRGGTDTTACFIGNVIKADKVILWKNINGVLTSDPRIVKNTKTIDYLNYDEAEESGKVVCSKAIEYLKKSNTKMEVAYIKNYEDKTLVGRKKDSHTHIKLISYTKDCSLLKIKSPQMTKEGFLHKISSLFHSFEVNMSFIRNSRDTMYISIENNQRNVRKLFDKLNEISNLTIDRCSIINIIGKLDWQMAIDVNMQLKIISKNPQIGVFPHEDCSRLEAIIASDELDKILNNFHSKFILNN